MDRIISDIYFVSVEAAQLAEDYFYLASKHLRLREINREILRSRGGWENFESQANQTKLANIFPVYCMYVFMFIHLYSILFPLVEGR